jgi:hypothetical protein
MVRRSIVTLVPIWPVRRSMLISVSPFAAQRTQS